MHPSTLTILHCVAIEVIWSFPLAMIVVGNVNYALKLETIVAFHERLLHNAGGKGF